MLRSQEGLQENAYNAKYKTYQDWKQHDPNQVLLSDTEIRRLGTASNFVAHKPDPHAAKIANNPHAHT